MGAAGDVTSLLRAWWTGPRGRPSPADLRSLGWALAIAALAAAFYLGVDGWYRPRFQIFDPSVAYAPVQRVFEVGDPAERVMARYPIGVFDNSIQRVTYLGVLGVFLAVVLASLGGLLRRTGPVPGWVDRASGPALWLAAACMLLAPDPPWFPRFWFLLLVPVLALAADRRRPTWRAVDGVALAATLAVLVWYSGRILSVPVDLSQARYQGFIGGQLHHVEFLGAADRLVRGDRVDGIYSTYGIGLPLVLGAVQKLGFLRTWGSQLVLYDWLQWLGVVFFAGLLWVWSRGRGLVVGLAVALMLNFHRPALRLGLFPQAGMVRFLPLLLYVAVMLGLRRRTRRPAAFLLGFLGALLTLSLFGLGVACSAGAVVFLVVKYRLVTPEVRVRSLVETAGIFLAGAATGVGAIFLGYLLVFDHVPRVASLVSISDMAMRLSRYGVIASPVPPFVYPLAVLVVTLFQVFRAVVFTEGPASHRQAVRAGVGTSILVWGMYWVNGPVDPRFGGLHMLFALYVADIARRAALWRRGRLGIAGFLGFLFLLRLHVPEVTRLWTPGQGRREHFVTYRRSTRYSDPPLVRDPVPREEMAGVLVRADDAHRIRTQAGFLQAEVLRGRRPVFLTEDSYLVPLEADVFSPLPALDICGSSHLESTLQAQIDWILASGEATVLIDLPPGPGPMADLRRPMQQTILGEARRRVSEHFRLQREEAGWQVWVRRDPSRGLRPDAGNE